jgi:hypothetical protein
MMKSDRRVNFTVHCPNGHEKALDYDLENLRIWLKAAVFQVTCTVCGDSWLLSNEERRNLAKYTQEPAGPKGE